MKFGFKVTGIIGEPQWPKEFPRKTIYVFVLLVQSADNFILILRSSNTSTEYRIWYTYLSPMWALIMDHWPLLKSALALVVPSIGQDMGVCNQDWKTNMC